jgi:prepilin-type N-terminal cleavage/methylation domain-containing protein
MFLPHRQQGFSLLEMIAVVAILGLVAAVIIPRVLDSDDAAKIAACHVFRGDIEIQAEVWNHNNHSWPAGNLAVIGADLNYFPEGVPTCPVDGTQYLIDPTTGLVIGHGH